MPSAISYSVRQLEEWLAVPLFERRHRDVELTPAGALFVKEARDVIKNEIHTSSVSDDSQRLARTIQHRR